MSVELISWALRESPVASKAELLVLIVLADHAHRDGGSAFPSVTTIAKLARLSPRGVHYALNSLKTAGLIRAEARPGRTTLYRVVTPATSAGVQPVQGATSAGGVCKNGHKPLQPLHPNRKEPSPNREDDFSRFDEAVIES